MKDLARLADQHGPGALRVIVVRTVTVGSHTLGSCRSMISSGRSIGTLTSASPLSREIFKNPQWDAAAVERFVNRVMGATVVTVGPGGTPHAAVVLVACLDGVVYFTASIGSALLRNLQRQATVALTVVNPEHDVLVQGAAAQIGRSAEVPDLLRRLHGLARRGRFTPPGWDGFLYAVAIDKIGPQQ